MLKYFATNRATEHLGRAVGKGNSGDRHKLSRGGYYFVDMEEYMRFYLATTDAGEMPAEAIVRDSDQHVFGDFLTRKEIGAIVVCVHGFNVELFEALTWFRVLVDTMKHVEGVGDRIVTSPAELSEKTGVKDGTLTAFIGFSWPSNGNVISYGSDQKEAVGSAAAFASLIARLKLTGKKVNLVCHSMGNFLACHTFANLVNKLFVPPAAVDNRTILDLLERGSKEEHSEVVTRSEDDWLIDNYVMLAPDVERRHVTKCDGGAVETEYVGQFYSGLQHLVRRKINFYSRFDGALAVSNLEKVPREAIQAVGDTASKLTFGLLDFLERNPDQRWEKRLGEAPAPFNAAPGFTSVNATELANRRIDHSDHIDSRPVAERIAAELGIAEEQANPTTRSTG